MTPTSVTMQSLFVAPDSMVMVTEPFLTSTSPSSFAFFASLVVYIWKDSIFAPGTLIVTVLLFL